MAYNLDFEDDFGSDEEDFQRIFMDQLEHYNGIPDYALDVDMDEFLMNMSPEDPYDYFFSDNDFDDTFSEEDDEDDDHNKIFVTLQDSDQILRKLRYHKSAGRFRLPKATMPETYESLLHLLGEVEILLKAWKKRTDHPFTAHIQRKDANAASSSSTETEKVPKFGVDYSDHDMEHESDSDQEHEIATTVNETLTKKKFCQSTKSFYDVFDTDKQFELFLARIRFIRKYIYGIIFSLFRGNLPEAISRQLPDELWEKVWKFTQVQYDESTALIVGYQANGETDIEMEMDRITDLFGAVGNFHMLLFEILFKHSYITTPSPLTELTSMELGAKTKVSYIKYLFTWYSKILEKNFNRLLDLDNGASDSDLSVSAITSSSPNINAIRRGRVSITRQEVIANLNGKDSVEIKSDFMVGADYTSDIVAYIDQTELRDRESYVNVIIYNVLLNKTVAILNTGIKFLSVCYQPRHCFTLSRNRFAILNRNTISESDSFELHHWEFESQKTNQVIPESQSKVEIFGLLAAKEDHSQTTFASTNVFLKLLEIRGNDFYLLCAQNPFVEETTIRLFNASNGEEDKQMLLTFPNKHLSVDCIKGSRVFLKDQNNEFILCDVSCAKIVAHYSFKELCQDADHDHNVDTGPTSRCIYEVKFDQDPKTLQFLLFSQNFTSYQLLEYEEDDGEDDIPMVIASGGTLVHDLNWRVMSQTSLLNGCLYVFAQREIHLRTHSGDYYCDNTGVHCAALFAIDTTDASVNPIISTMMLPFDCEFEAAQNCVLMNEFDRYFHAQETMHASKNRLYFCSEDTLLLPFPYKNDKCVTLKFHKTAQDLLTADAVVFARRAEERIIKRRAEEEKMQKMLKEAEEKRQRLALENERLDLERKEKEEEKKLAESKFINQQVTLTGKVIKWSFSYGFIQILTKEAKVLGNIFVHISDILDRGGRRITLGQKVNFEIASAERDGRIKAVKVHLI